jgi:hypothetical protein
MKPNKLDDSFADRPAEMEGRSAFYYADAWEGFLC